MNTVTFKSVLDGVATRMGLEPDVNLQLNQATALVEYITDRLGKFWERAAWPEWTTSQLRQYRPTFNEANAYNVGDEVYYPPNNAYYVCIAATSPLPSLDPAFWSPAPSLDTYVATDQAWEADELGHVWGVYADDPRKTPSPRMVSWWMGPEGVWVDTSLTKVYVEFSKTPPAFTTRVWDAVTSYVAGDLVYYAATGECYRALTASINLDPSNFPATWKLQAFPAILARTVKLAAIADALREDENLSKASAWDVQASDALVDALDRAWSAMRTQPTFSLGR